MNHEHHHEHDHECCGHDCRDPECGGRHGNTAHHVHGHDSGCACASCHALDDIFSENEVDEREQRASFRREITFLAAAGAIFLAALVLEELAPEIMPEWLFSAVFIALYLATGVPVLKTALKALFKGDVFNEFTLMGGATLAAVAIGEMSEAVGVMLFYRLGEAFQERASSNSRRSIKALLAQKPLTARIVVGGRIVERDPKEIVKGDVVQVLPGEIIPIDGHVISGVSQIDASAITGESMPTTACLLYTSDAADE